MVRSNELGCRNGWDADLWVAANAEGSTQRAQPQNPIGKRAASEVEPAEQSDLITSIVAAKTDNITLPNERPLPAPSAPRATIEEDIFVKQTPSLTWSNGPISAQPATELVQNPKAAILRARDQFRQRRRSEGRLADRELAAPSAPMLASSREAQQVADREVAPPEPAPESLDPRYENRPLLRPQPEPPYMNRRPVSPVSLREIERPFPSMTDFPEDRVKFESVPQIEEGTHVEEVEDFLDDDAWIETRQLDTIPPEPYVIDELFEEDEIVSLDERGRFEEEELSVRHRESMLNRFLRHRRERRQASIYVEEPLDIEPPVHAMQSAPARDTPVVESLLQPSERLQNRSLPARMDETQTSLDEDFVLPPPLPEYLPREAASATSPYEPRYRSQPRPAPRPHSSENADSRFQPASDEFGDQPLFASSPAPAVHETYEVYPANGNSDVAAYPTYRMDRICQTCRDFRPADNGERGWCNNKWAFNHRRMVDADDLACRNSLGSWWTPKDDVWRRDGDISRHAQQTPRVDQWIFGITSDEQGRRRSGS
jgi:hypothetical protein